VFAEPLAAALHVNDDIPAHCGRVVVLGDGKLGQLIARALVASGRETVVVGHHEEKLALVRAAGARGMLESGIGTELHGVDAVVEATGSAGGLDLALRLVKPRGTVVLKTTVANPGALDLSRVVIDEIRVVGSRCGDMSRAVDVLAQHQVEPASLIAARYSLGDAATALRHAARPGTLKVLVTAT
jgi:threonine dehydrogenase-like Zn-dependent dehydrogenase